MDHFTAMRALLCAPPKQRLDDAPASYALGLTLLP